MVKLILRRAGNSLGLARAYANLRQACKNKHRNRLPKLLTRAYACPGPTLICPLRFCLFLFGCGLRRARRARIGGWGNGHQNLFLFKQAYAELTRELRAHPTPLASWIVVDINMLWRRDGGRRQQVCRMLCIVQCPSANARTTVKGVGNRREATMREQIAVMLIALLMMMMVMML